MQTALGIHHRHPGHIQNDQVGLVLYHVFEQGQGRHKLSGLLLVALQEAVELYCLGVNPGFLEGFGSWHGDKPLGTRDI
jgi:hypothetical protein